MRKATFFYLLRRGLLTGAGGFIRDGLVMASKFITQGLTHPAQGSAEFDGASDYILSPVDANSGTLSVGAWCYYDGSKSLNTLLNFQPHQTLAISLNRTGANETYVYIGNGSSWIGVPAINVTATQANQWFYLAFTADGTTSKLYIDGSLVGSFAGVPTGINTDEFPIGAVEPSPGTFSERISGNLANVAIWNRALSSDEINSVMWKGYDALEASEKSGLQAWYRLDDISGTSVPDSSGNGNNGTAY